MMCLERVGSAARQTRQSREGMNNVLCADDDQPPKRVHAQSFNCDGKTCARSSSVLPEPGWSCEGSAKGMSAAQLHVRDLFTPTPPANCITTECPHPCRLADADHDLSNCLDFVNRGSVVESPPKMPLQLRVDLVRKMSVSDSFVLWIHDFRSRRDEISL